MYTSVILPARAADVVSRAYVQRDQQERTIDVADREPDRAAVTRHHRRRSTATAAIASIAPDFARRKTRSSVSKRLA